jgi:uncharacterized protein YndB with AHSA1/START domain
MKSPVIVSREFEASPARVWSALTKYAEMKEWYFDLPGFMAEEGDEFQFYGGDDKQYLHLCKVVAVIPEKQISYTWRYNGFPGDSLVTFELSPVGENTTLTVTHTGLETFPANNPDFAKANFEAGWTEIIGTSLKKYLEK